MLKDKYNKQYYLKNKKIILGKQKEYNRKHKRSYEETKQALKKYRLSMKERYNAAKTRIKKKGLKFTLTFTQYCNLFKAFDNKCDYCKKDINNQGLGLDRMDNKKGYSIKNVVLCCKQCNIMKNSFLSYLEMHIAMGALRNYWGETSSGLTHERIYKEDDEYEWGNHLKEEHDKDTKKT